jgi:hypothetical protein
VYANVFFPVKEGIQTGRSGKLANGNPDVEGRAMWFGDPSGAGDPIGGREVRRAVTGAA